MDEVDRSRPLGRGSYVVKSGEGLSELAERHGLFWQTIWHHPDNEDLRIARERPEVLLPGDRLTIPAIRLRKHVCAVDRKHRFRRKGVPATLVVNVRDYASRPLVGKEYEFVIGDRVHTGRTGENGRVEHWTATSARSATLTVWPAEPHLPSRLVFVFELSHLDPVETLRGLRDRLHNLGYLCPRGDEPLDPHTRAAITSFQAANDLPTTGEPDDATAARLVAVHGS